MGHMCQVHHLHSCVTQNTRWRAPSHSLIYSSPNAYMILPLLNLQHKFCKTKDPEGLFAKLTSPQNFKAQYAKQTSPRPFLGNYTPKSYMASHVWDRKEQI